MKNKYFVHTEIRSFGNPKDWPKYVEVNGMKHYIQTEIRSFGDPKDWPEYVKI
jgi:hypothetical protein